MAHLIKIPEASRLTGIPVSTLRKCFMRVRPENVPMPPPHKRIGRAIYVMADRLEGWVESLGEKKRGRPTVPERIAKKEKVNG